MKDQQKTPQRNPEVHDPSKILHKTPRKASVGNPDQQERPDPGKTHNIDDDPDQTKRKIPVEDPRERDGL
ncbi:MAG TPA: hypothetical protein VHE34_23100 [Puia sp.]|uniref:hypothetical protein n=1 Tax=Puia sp. TaxID=2045100 RepID=UPI002C20ABE8|nr:hypothetical protein [Puia sp.]HVU98138.1 hypothetical protein [Puia sp.]